MAQDPSTIGRYKVLRKLGGGGMGVVYLALDAVLKRQVAIKLVRGSFAEHEHAMLRFQREAEVSARLNHPNVIVVYDVGEEPGFGPFIAMEFVAGADLDQMIRERRLDDEGRIQVLIQAARALEAAHGAGIVHRDVKPANLLVSTEGRVKLLDFGIARGDDSTLTTTGMFLGTPGFMAPEQIKGDDASPATDRYAFHVLALELLSGRRPFRADSTPALLYRIVNDPPDIADDLPAALRAVFERALAKDPAARFPDLRSFLLALIEASPLPESRRATLRTLVGSSDTVDLDRTQAAEATVAATVAAAAQKPVLREGVSGRSLGRVLAGAGIVAGAGLGLALWLVPRDEARAPLSRAPVVAQATAAPAPAASPAVLVAPVASPSAVGVAVAATAAPAREPAPSVAEPREVVAVPAVEPTAARAARADDLVAPGAGAEPARPAARPTAAPVRQASVPEALAPAASPTAARRAAQPTAIAKRARRDGATRGTTASAPSAPPAAPAAPAWGEIRSEGAQRTD